MVLGPLGITGIGFYLGIAALAFAVVRFVTADVHDTTAWAAFRVGYPVGTIAVVACLAAVFLAIGRPVGTVHLIGLTIDTATMLSVGLWGTLVGLLVQVALLLGLVLADRAVTGLAVE
ncbi:hypothetical protein [Halomicrobium salinisoli]|uniref:hypothetical protein n=1 Tax=Halomicrobium salinisoli TaxID=2878391 RepID=UPI001CF0578A|nr:hypothetical protein [Halomicrobium salinisoli]